MTTEQTPVPRRPTDDRGSAGRPQLTARELILGVLFFVLVWTATGIAAIVLIWLLQLAGVWVVPDAGAESTAGALLGALTGGTGPAGDPR